MIQMKSLILLKEQFSEMTNLEQVVKECKDNGLWSPDGLFTDSGVEAS